MSDYLSKYRKLLVDENLFGVTWELVPGRGSFETEQAVAMACAEKAAKGGRIHAVTIADNPGGNPAISAEMLSAEVNRLGIEPLVHFTCKDKNRNQLEGLLHALERSSVRNLLVMTGDYSCSGYEGRPKPVFDLDATQLLGLITSLNKGLDVSSPRRTRTLAPTHFFAGAVVSPFKASEAEVMGQYYKLKKKLVAGAQFVVTQLGYDARKFHEVLLIMKHLGFDHVPLIANVYVLSRLHARLMNENKVPGSVVTDKLLSVIAEECTAKDKGKAKSLERAAKMYAFMKGMGFAGVHIAGPRLEYEDVELIIEMGEALVPNWRGLIPEFDFPQPNGWYYFDKDRETGLNTETPMEISKGASLLPLSYQCFRLLRSAMFDETGILFKPMRSLAQGIDGSALERAFTRMEHLALQVTNGCAYCGDCGLPDVAGICPVSQCPKGQRNGPCGGSFQGWCEVFPKERQCIYVGAYARLSHYEQQDSLGTYEVPPVDYDPRHTSSWLNYYMGRDHTAKRLGLKPPRSKAAEPTRHEAEPPKVDGTHCVD
jgi:methylenetetrahydrofolate reductase (NADPH)